MLDFWRITILYIYKLTLYGDQYYKINHVGHNLKGFSLNFHMLYHVCGLCGTLKCEKAAICEMVAKCENISTLNVKTFQR